MPRFGTKSLLIAFAVVALWLSSLSGYYFGADLRNAILLSIFVPSGIAAIYNQGRRRAFWLAFWVVMLLHGVRFGNSNPIRYVSSFNWLNQAFSRTVASSPEQMAAIPGFPAARMGENLASFFEATIRAAWVLALATLVGYIAVYIYDQSRKASER